MMDPGSIAFPRLGIELHNVPKQFSLFGLPVAVYGCIIAAGILAAVLLAAYDRRSRGLSEDPVWDLALYGVLSGIAGARIYYVVFRWDYYSRNLLSIFNLRQGGLAIYGGVIGGFLSTYIYCRIKKESITELFDSVALAFPLGQAVGRWGNFFNREAFGGWSSGLLAMRLPVSAVRSSDISEGIMAHMMEGMDYIDVHPTFLYESFWNICLLVILLSFRKKKKKSGDIFLIYLFGYGLGRAWIEGLRTDQLLLPFVSLPVSQLLACLCVIAAGMALIIRHRKEMKGSG